MTRNGCDGAVTEGPVHGLTVVIPGLVDPAMVKTLAGLDDECLRP